MIIGFTKKNMTIICSSVVFFMFAVAMTIYAASVVKVTLNCDGAERSLVTASSTVGDVLAEQGVVVGEYDKVIPHVGKTLQLNKINNITVKRAVMINFTFGGETKEV